MPKEITKVDRSRSQSPATNSLEALCHLEEDKHYACGDYLCTSCGRRQVQTAVSLDKSSTSTSSETSINSAQREEMVDWTYQVSIHLSESI